MLVLQPMKKVLFIFLFLPVTLFAQERITLIGNVFDGLTFFPIDGVNVYNFSSKKYSFTNKEGNFEILARLGDTVVISKAVYKQHLIEITEEMMEKKRLDFAIFYKVVILKEVNVYSLPATYDDFKREFVSVKLSDFYDRLGGTTLSAEDRIGYTANNLLDLIPGKAGEAVRSPITALYNAFSKKVKMDRLYREMVENQEEVDNLPLKYNRELVTSLTGLEGEDLLDFMTFCKFSYYDLVRWSPEYIVVQIKNRFGDYEFYKALEED
jgi:hypothetical protein